jgi:hypothetical protein
MVVVNRSNFERRILIVTANIRGFDEKAKPAFLAFFHVVMADCVNGQNSVRGF